MKIQHGPSFFLLCLIVFVYMLGSSGCANIVPPLGGPRDSTPPRLIYVTPRDSTKLFNINTKKIVFNFDEYIDPRDVRTELIVSPVPKIEPIVDAKLKTLTVRIKDTLQPNTTYSFNFGNAIRDVNEGNVLKGFTYVFSTGSYIDSMTFSGSVLVANTGKVDSTLIIMLHRSLDDSAVVKEKPRYVARVDSMGRFRFRWLEPGKYALYAMKDDAGTRRYLSASSLFAFSDTPVIVGPGTPPSTLYAFVEPDTAKKTPKAATGKGGNAIKNPEKEKDKEKDKRLQLQANISNGEFDILDTFRLQFATPMKVFDSTKIRLTSDDFTDIAPGNYRFRRDSTNKIFAMIYTWPTDTKYHLILPKDFGEDTSGRKLLKNDTFNFRTKKDIEYGEVRVRILNLDITQKPVLQFFVGDAIKFSYSFKTGKEFRQLLFAPGEYELRVLYDTNGNGVWDAGQFFGKHRQPEKVIPIKKKLTVKANWDNDVDITL